MPVRGTRKLHRLLAVLQVAFSLLLLSGAGLTLQSFGHLMSLNSGFEAEKILTIRNSIRGEALANRKFQVAHFEGVIQRLETLPGVESVSAVSFPPPLSAFLGQRYQVDGLPVDASERPFAGLRVVASRYFETMGIGLLSGRSIDGTDREDSQPVAVINQAVADSLGGNPIGRQLNLDGQPPRQIVGIVSNVRGAGADSRPVPAIYLPLEQSPMAIMNLVIRAKQDPHSLIPAVEREVWALNSNGNVYGTAVLADSIADQYWTSRLLSELLAGFAILALLLGSAGIYAVISSSVTQRLHEMGVRIALGADRADIRKLVLREGFQVTLVGIGFGLLLAAGLGRFLSSQLFGVAAWDPLTYLVVAGLLLVVGAAACWFPARRAIAVDPVRILQGGA